MTKIIKESQQLLNDLGNKGNVNVEAMLFATMDILAEFLQLLETEIGDYNGRLHKMCKLSILISKWAIKGVETFDSAVHKNWTLDDVTKFKYLKGLLTGAARTCIIGLIVSSEYDKHMVELLVKHLAILK